MNGLPTPPIPSEEHFRSHHHAHGMKRSHHSSSSKSSSSAHHHHHHQPPTPPTESHTSHAVADVRHKRVWKACERCRMKKTKCDGEFPCKRCKDDGLVCTAGTRKKTEYKQLPRGYAEVLENSQFALIATVHKLYAMVRTNQRWDLGEPELNERGQPVIHNIASKLGCIRPNSDIDLPVHSVFPEDEAGLAELARQLEDQQARDGLSQGSHHEASPSELDPSELDEADYRRVAFGSASAGSVAMSPRSMTYNDFDTSTPDSFPGHSPALAGGFSPAWPTSRGGGSIDLSSQQFLASGGQYMDIDLLNQSLLEAQGYGTIKPHVLSCPNPDVMLGIEDPMMYTGYDAELMRL
ncbi:hypothetical protein GQ53DRAFT_665490 [Thozetella sp. PMI_491]|nr:hypothetical protein GQ53DRAFT_665490 [Thozetella sp. PMI_491]